MTMALMTKENSPKVMMVSGKPKNFKIGVTIILKRPKTNANTMAEEKSVKRTPSKTLVSK